MLIGSINNKGSLQGRINSATYLTGVISTAGLLGGKIVAERGLKGEKGDTGDTGATGNGIASVTFVSSSGLVDTYKITFTNGTETTFDVTNGQDGIDGIDGADGFSPIANVAKVGDTATITITDEDGTTTATITDGQDGIDGQDGHSPVVTASKVGKVTIVSVDGSAIATINDGNDGQDGTDGTDGQDGYSPSASVTKSGSVATISITDKNGTTTASVSDGSGVPSGGTAGQVLTKDSGTDYDVSWEDPSGGTITDVTVDGTSIVDNGVAELETVTQLRDGLMVATDKQKLDGIASGAEVNVNADWSAVSGDAQILNKPTIPTKTSDLTNDSGYITSSALPTKVSDLTNDSGFITSSSLPTDLSDLNNDMNVSDFPNDAGYITGYTETDPTVPSWAKQVSKPAYTASEVGALPDTTVIPSATSTTPAMDGTASVGSESTFAKGDHVHPHDTSKQDTLISGTNIKTVNNTSLLGSGDLPITLSGLGVHISTSDPTSADGSNGDIWLKYEVSS